MVILKPGQSLYEALGVEKTAEASEIRKAYLKFAVQLHPDKNPDDAEAKERFQTLQKIYSILSDPEKRKVYDRTGSLEDTEELSGEQFDNLYNFYRSMFAAVTDQDIDEFGAQYKGGAEERGDLLVYYEEFEGDMSRVLDWVMLSDPVQDSHRFMDIINSAIDSGEVQRYKKYTTWAAAVAKKKRPPPLVPGKSTNTKSKYKKLGKAERESSEQALVAMMKQKGQGAYQGMLSSLASKYGVDDGDFPPEPTEEEFEAARQRMAANQKSGAAGKESKKKQSGTGDGSGESKKQKKKKK